MNSAPRPAAWLADAACLLFVPGHRPDRFAKALAACPSGIVIDLEDAVPAAEKATARAHAAAYAKGAGAGAPVLVRLNPLGTRSALDDLATLADGTLQPAGWFLAKVEDPRDIEIIRALDPARRPLVATLESARGMAAAPAIAKSLGPDDALALGGADLAADLGADLAFEPLLLARLSLVQAAAAAGVAALDVPLLDLADATALTSETRRVRALGFTGKLAIHPAQVQTVLDAFRPTVEEIDRARRTLDALAAAGGGVARIDGRMIDEPLARSARRVLARAGHPIA